MPVINSRLHLINILALKRKQRFFGEKYRMFSVADALRRLCFGMHCQTQDTSREYT